VSILVSHVSGDHGAPKLQREFEATAAGVCGGHVAPLTTDEVATRAYLYAANPLRNPFKEVLDRFDTVEKTPPMFGIFNDIPWHKLREDEVKAWANAGFSFIVADGEHSLSAGRLDRDSAAMLLRNGIVPVQRLHREARSEHGDQLTMGCRATMRPYGRTVEECNEYLDCCRYPEPGRASENSRGGFPLRRGNRDLIFTPGELRAAETETQAWVQFETMEYIMPGETRDAVLESMAREGRNKACGFIGPFDALMRSGAGVPGVEAPNVSGAVDALIKESAAKGVHMGRVCGSGTCSEPKEIEDAIVQAINNGCRIVSSHYLTSDLPYLGAKPVCEPFFAAAKRCGF